MQLFSCTLNLVDNAVQPSGYRAALQSKLCADIHLRDCIQQIHFRNLGILYAKSRFPDQALSFGVGEAGITYGRAYPCFCHFS